MMASDAASDRELTARGERTRTRLLEAARPVFNERGFRATRIIDITRAAGTASGTFYTYFESKEEIFREVASEVHRELEAASRNDARSHGDDPVRNIETATRSFFLACRRNAGIVRSIENLAMHDAVVEAGRSAAMEANARRVERWLRVLQDAGTADRDLDAANVAEALQAMNVKVAYDNLVHRAHGADLDALVAAVTRIWAKTAGLE